MVLEAGIWSTYQQAEVYRLGKTTDGRQWYWCTAGRCTFQLQYWHKVCEPGARQRIAAMALNGSGIHDSARVLGISPQKVMGSLKKPKP